MFKICITVKPSIKRSDENLDQNTRCFWNIFLEQLYIFTETQIHTCHMTQSSPFYNVPNIQLHKVCMQKLTTSLTLTGEEINICVLHTQ